MPLPVYKRLRLSTSAISIFRIPYYTSLQFVGDVEARRIDAGVDDSHRRQHQRVPSESRPAEVHGSRLPPPVLAPEPCSGVRNLEWSQGIPTNVVTRLRGRWTCPVHRPASSGVPVAIAAKGALSGAWVANDIDPFGRKAGDLVVRGGLRLLPAPAPSPMGTPGSVNKAGPRVAPRGSRRAGNGRRLFPARGYAVLPLT